MMPRFLMAEYVRQQTDKEESLEIQKCTNCCERHRKIKTFLSGALRTYALFLPLLEISASTREVIITDKRCAAKIFKPIILSTNILKPTLPIMNRGPEVEQR